MVQRLFYSSSLFYVVIFAGVLSSQVYSAISEPIPLSPPPTQQPTNSSEPYYPPATEAYNPGIEPAPLVPLESLQTQMLPHHPPLVNKTPLRAAPKAIVEGGQDHISREELERVAAECKGEVVQLWQQKSQFSGRQLSHFQKKIGDAKLKCDQLNEIMQSFKEADTYMRSFQKSMQEAQTPPN
jgi:hypothetical protein